MHSLRKKDIENDLFEKLREFMGTLNWTINATKEAFEGQEGDAAAAEAWTEVSLVSSKVGSFGVCCQLDDQHRM